MRDLSIKANRQLLIGMFLVSLGVFLPANSFADNFSSYIKNNFDGSQTLTGHVPLEVRNGAAILKHHANFNLSAQIIMPLANQVQLNTLLQNLYDPKSSSFHQFLTPTQFAQQFAPSVIDLIQVREYLKKVGVIITGQSANGAVLNVSGPVSSFEQAFGLHINNYQKSDGTLFYAPDAEPSIPVTVAGKILAVGGLDNLPKYVAHRQQYPLMVMPKAVGSGPGGYLAPNDVKTAYNLNAISSTGTGQAVALFELDGYQAKDITAYESKFGLPNVPLQNVVVDAVSVVPNFNAGADEVTLDIELVTAFAPGTSTILVYEAPLNGAVSSNQAWIDEWTKIATDNKAKVISCSWGESEIYDTASRSFDNQIFKQMAAQGQAVFVASGDDGAFDAGGKTLAVDEPSAQPYATAVGISKLATATNGAYSNETASISGGGGVSAVQTIPSFQSTLASKAAKAAFVSTTMRNLPDVVLTADATTPYAFYINGAWAGFYGSSISAPIWASFISRVNQGLGKNAPIGSVNTALYQLAQGSSGANDFHDIATGNNGYYQAEPGFDNATGLGSFNGLNLYNDLVKNVVPVSIPSVPTGLGVTAGNALVTLSWNASLGATSYNLQRSTSTNGVKTTISITAPSTSYTDSSVNNGTTYYYAISAVNTAGQSSNSAQVSAKPMLPPAPNAVTNLTGSATTYHGQRAILLEWKQSISLNIVMNRVYRSTAGVPVYYGNVSAVNGVYDLGVKSGTTYSYYVTAVNSSGVESLSSNIINVREI